MCEACLFCIYPLSAAVCTVLFPEHRNTADALAARPPSNPTATAQGAPCPHLQGDPLSLSHRYVRCSQDYAYALDLGRRVELDVIWRTLG